MSLEDEETWPPGVLNFLANSHDLFLNWELRNEYRVTSKEYDSASCRLRDILSTNYVFRGYHCTRLTDSEIQHIRANGMQLPNKELLHKRIDSIKQEGLINSLCCEHLKNINQADEPSRAGRIWFCFFPPYRDGQGLERLFRSWGGEALYNSHESDPVYGPILKRIGTPCIIEAYVPIISLPRYDGLEDKVVRRYLVNRGLKTAEGLDESCAEQPIPSQNIFRIIPFSDSAFLKLTQCYDWEPPLT